MLAEDPAARADADAALAAARAGPAAAAPEVRALLGRLLPGGLGPAAPPPAGAAAKSPDDGAAAGGPGCAAGIAAGGAGGAAASRGSSLRWGPARNGRCGRDWARRTRAAPTGRRRG